MGIVVNGNEIFIEKEALHNSEYVKSIANTIDCVWERLSFYQQVFKKL